jgi:hypothetical protein
MQQSSHLVFLSFYCPNGNSSLFRFRAESLECSKIIENYISILGNLDINIVESIQSYEHPRKKTRKKQTSFFHKYYFCEKRRFIVEFEVDTLIPEIIQEDIWKYFKHNYERIISFSVAQYNILPIVAPVSVR